MPREPDEKKKKNQPDRRRVEWTLVLVAFVKILPQIVAVIAVVLGL